MINNVDIVSQVPADDIRIAETPRLTSDKEIIFKDYPGKSEPVLDAEHGTLQIQVFVRDSVDQPYKTLRTIVDLILSNYNKKNETLQNSTARIRNFLKNAISYYHNDVEEYRSAVMNFDYLHGGITE